MKDKLRAILLELQGDADKIQAAISEMLVLLETLDLPPTPVIGPICDECFCGNGTHTTDCTKAPTEAVTEHFRREPVDEELLEAMRGWPYRGATR